MHAGIFSLVSVFPSVSRWIASVERKKENFCYYYHNRCCAIDIAKWCDLFEHKYMITQNKNELFLKLA